MESGAMAPLSGKTENDSFGCWLFVNFIMVRVRYLEPPDRRLGVLKHKADGAGSQGPAR